MWDPFSLVVAAVPLGVHYIDYPATFRSRFDAASTFEGWIDRERAESARSTVAILAGQARDAVMSPFAVNATLFVFLPERSDELDVVRDRYPDDVELDHRPDDGRPLYITYRIAGA